MAPPPVTALPMVKTLKDCVDFHQTVTAHRPQFEGFIKNFLEAATSIDSLERFYVTTNPLVTAFAFSLALAPIFLVVSEINRNYSQVDRCWSLLPTVYAAHWALWSHLAGGPTQRVDLQFAVIAIWSARLTYNYWRKGGYSIGSEDYRWEIIKSKVPAPVFFVFNVIFIATIQSVLLFSVQTPAYILLLTSRVTGDILTTADYAFAGAMLLAVAISAVADQQQWNFQNAKQEYLKTAKVPSGWSRDDLDRGFLVRGLWAWSRHPNFAAEQSVWVILYQWSCWETYSWYSWAGAGALSYLALFQGSTWLTELISAGKYPAYKEYQKRVSRFLPKFTTAFTGPVPETKVSKSKGKAQVKAS